MHSLLTPPLSLNLSFISWLYLLPYLVYISNSITSTAFFQAAHFHPLFNLPPSKFQPRINPLIFFCYYTQAGGIDGVRWHVSRGDRWDEVVGTGQPSRLVETQTADSRDALKNIWSLQTSIFTLFIVFFLRKKVTCLPDKATLLHLCSKFYSLSPISYLHFHSCNLHILSTGYFLQSVSSFKKFPWDRNSSGSSLFFTV